MLTSSRKSIHFHHSSSKLLLPMALEVSLLEHTAVLKTTRPNLLLYFAPFFKDFINKHLSMTTNGKQMEPSMSAHAPWNEFTVVNDEEFWFLDSHKINTWYYGLWLCKSTHGIQSAAWKFQNLVQLFLFVFLPCFTWAYGKWNTGQNNMIDLREIDSRPRIHYSHNNIATAH